MNNVLYPDFGQKYIWKGVEQATSLEGELLQSSIAMCFAYAHF